MALIPRSESARLIDFVKFRGMVEGSRRSELVSERDICDLQLHYKIC